MQRQHGEMVHLKKLRFAPTVAPWWQRAARAFLLSLGTFAAQAQECRQWVNVTPAQAPAPRWGHALAYDGQRNVAVLFGGGDNGFIDGETWEWDGTTWTLRSANGPAPRALHAMACDSKRGVTVLYGGYVPSYNWCKDETWEWDGLTWTPRAGSGREPLIYHGMAYDEARGAIVASRGSFCDYDSNETREWNGSAWVLRNATDNVDAYSFPLAYDAVRGAVVRVMDNEIARAMQVHEWNGSAWTLRATGGPPLRFDHAIAYDARRRTTLLFGGAYVDLNGVYSYGDTWEWNGTAWRQLPLSGPAARSNHTMVYDSARDVIMLFGGLNEGTPDGVYGDTWELRRLVARGDANCDGFLDFFDLNAYVLGLLGDEAGYLAAGGAPDCWATRLCWGDVNDDGVFDFFDLDPFIELLSGG